MVDVNTSSGDMGTDYSDFQYQQVTLVQRVDAADGNVSSTSTALVNFEPLGAIGGLANNEVAELVAYRLEIGFDGADPQVAGDQDVGGTMHIQGSVGANIDPDALPESGQGVTVDESDNNRTFAVERADDAIFEMYQAEASLPFDDETNGQGGGGYFQTDLHDRNWRELTGRGPVLDQNDDLTVVQETTNNDSVIEPEVTVTVHCVWDVAETSDAGRRFSVPADD